MIQVTIKTNREHRCARWDRVLYDVLQHPTIPGEVELVKCRPNNIPGYPNSKLLMATENAVEINRDKFPYTIKFHGAAKDILQSADCIMGVSIMLKETIAGMGFDWDTERSIFINQKSTIDAT